MRFRASVLAILTISGMLAARSEAIDKADEAAIQGTWKIVSAEIGGEFFPVEAFNKVNLVLKDGNYEMAIDRGTYELKDVDGLKAIDVVGKEGPNQGKTIPAIFEIKGDSMKICYDLAGKTRPAKFETEKGTRQFLARYERVTK